MTLKTNINNFILSYLDIDRIKLILGKTPVLNILFKILSQSLIDYKYPVHIFVESTRLCNLQCQSCPRDIKAQKSGHMDFGLFKKIIDEATAFGRKNFCLHMLGEPILHPQIAEMVEYIKRMNSNHSILLTTNGYLLDNNKAERFLKSNVDKITFSLFSLRPQRSKVLTGNANISKVIDNIKGIVGLAKKIPNKTKIFLRFLLCTENEDELKDLRTFVKDLGTRLEIRRTHNYSGIIENNYTAKTIVKKRYPCYHLWFSPAISWDGKVLLCCSDWNYSEVLGDIKNESLASIWQGNRINELRKLHLEGHFHQIPLCQKCNVWTLYPNVFF